MRATVVLLFLSFQVLAAEKLVRVKPHVVVAPFSEVTLEQLVDAHNLSEASRKKLAAITVMKAPEFGGKQEITNASLAPLLRAVVQQERDGSKDTVHLVLPKNIIVDTVKRSLNLEEIAQELLEAWKPLCADCRLELEALSPPAISALRDWSLEIKPQLPRGSFSVPIEIIKMDGSTQKAWVSGRLKIQRKVPVTKRMMSAAERLQVNDFEWEYRDISFAVDEVPVAEDIVGKRTRQVLRAGQILWPHILEKEKAIRQGELVQLKAGQGDWEVSLSVIAQQDGFVGDVISFKNPKTNSTLMGQILGRGEVELR